MKHLGRQGCNFDDAYVDSSKEGLKKALVQHRSTLLATKGNLGRYPWRDLKFESHHGPSRAEISRSRSEVYPLRRRNHDLEKGRDSTRQHAQHQNENHSVKRGCYSARQEAQRQTSSPDDDAGVSTK
ncbi:hypothetical protein Tco_0167222 [Tanacetum coccineum]